MFAIPLELVTKVGKGERFYCSSMGHGMASLGGNKVVVKVPSEGLRLGQRFIATATNRLIPEELANLLPNPPMDLVGKRSMPTKPMKRKFRKRK